MYAIQLQEVNTQLALIKPKRQIALALRVRTIHIPSEYFNSWPLEFAPIKLTFTAGTLSAPLIRLSLFQGEVNPVKTRCQRTPSLSPSTIPWELSSRLTRADRPWSLSGWPVNPGDLIYDICHFVHYGRVPAFSLLTCCRSRRQSAILVRSSESWYQNRREKNGRSFIYLNVSRWKPSHLYWWREPLMGRSNLEYKGILTPQRVCR